VWAAGLVHQAAVARLWDTRTTLQLTVPGRACWPATRAQCRLLVGRRLHTRPTAANLRVRECRVIEAVSDWDAAAAAAAIAAAAGRHQKRPYMQPLECLQQHDTH